MSQLLSRLSNLSARSHSLIRRFSSSLTTNPCLILSCHAELLASGERIGEVALFDAAKEDMLTVRKKTLSQELLDGNLLGASHGWVMLCDPHDRSVCINDLFNASKSDTKIIPLPPLTALKGCQNQVFGNVAMSSSPPDQEDQPWVVAIKFLGRQLSLCSPRRDLRWTNILTPSDYSENSNLMYSKRDQRFYLTAPGGHHFHSYDPNTKQRDMETYVLRFRDLPELPQSEWELLGLCRTKEYLVESVSTGELLLVKWYSRSYFNRGMLFYRTKRFMVFREVETTQKRYMCYTEDIGDMCIFLSKSEAFCVEASSCPGLQPNAIYQISQGFGIYDLTTGTYRSFKLPAGAPASITTLFWLPPVSI